MRMPREEVLKKRRRAGSLGGIARARNHTREELSLFSKNGGRPRLPRKADYENLKRKEVGKPYSDLREAKRAFIRYQEYLKEEAAPFG
jgi:hypothetical protein